MERKPIDPRIETGRETDDADPTGPAGDADPDDFRDALARWASTVTLAAVREGGAAGPVHGTTVTSFAPVAAEPPTVLISLGPGAQILPYLEEDGEVVVSFLAPDQWGLAARYADSYPVGPSPFPEEGPPVAEGCVVALLCRVRSVVEADGAARVVLARVTDVREGSGAAPLLYYRRDWAELDEG